MLPLQKLCTTYSVEDLSQCSEGDMGKEKKTNQHWTEKVVTNSTGLSWCPSPGIPTPVHTFVQVISGPLIEWNEVPKWVQRACMPREFQLHPVSTGFALLCRCHATVRLTFKVTRGRSGLLRSGFHPNIMSHLILISLLHSHLPFSQVNPKTCLLR